jgi:hypothetical protein
MMRSHYYRCCDRPSSGIRPEAAFSSPFRWLRRTWWLRGQERKHKVSGIHYKIKDLSIDGLHDMAFVFSIGG